MRRATPFLHSTESNQMFEVCVNITMRNDVKSLNEEIVINKWNGIEAFCNIAPTVLRVTCCRNK